MALNSGQNVNDFMNTHLPGFMPGGMSAENAMPNVQSAPVNYDPGGGPLPGPQQVQPEATTASPYEQEGNATIRNLEQMRKIDSDPFAVLHGHRQSEVDSVHQHLLDLDVNSANLANALPGHVAQSAGNAMQAGMNSRMQKANAIADDKNRMVHYTTGELDDARAVLGELPPIGETRATMAEKNKADRIRRNTEMLKGTMAPAQLPREQ